MFRLFSYREFIRRRRQVVLILWTLRFLPALSACEPVNRSGNGDSANSNTTNAAAEPTIEASPVSKTDDQWQVISADNITLSVTAPGAQSVKILYRPAFT